MIATKVGLKNLINWTEDQQEITRIENDTLDKCRKSFWDPQLKVKWKSVCHVTNTELELISVARLAVV